MPHTLPSYIVPDFFSFRLEPSFLFFFFQIEFLLREKMKTGYYTIKNTFKEFDPEGKGIVSR